MPGNDDLPEDYFSLEKLKERQEQRWQKENALWESDPEAALAAKRDEIAENAGLTNSLTGQDIAWVPQDRDIMMGVLDKNPRLSESAKDNIRALHEKTPEQEPASPWLENVARKRMQQKSGENER